MRQRIRVILWQGRHARINYIARLSKGNYMKQNFISVALTALAILLSTSLSCAAATNTVVAPEASSKAKATPQSDIAAKHKAAANIKAVDINNATREQLKILPGIGDAEADKIIAGRPYLSKANLVTHNIIDRGIYENFKKLIVVKKYKNAAKNAAINSKKK
jgi:competence protein ComEA